ncbi:MAG: hypothetical protein JNJ49_16265 [Bdellovibrionaceae bacterium]|nr:hypothetical protein [Pseudobdellovibrionaceae bacterium]
MTQRQLFSSSLLLFALLAGTSLDAHASGSAKSDTLGRLKEWRERTIELSRKAEETQRRELKALATASLKPDFSTPAGKEAAHREINGPLTEIENADIDRTEMSARLKIIDQLIFAVDTKFDGKARASSVSGFLEGQLMDFATSDLAEPGTGQWWKFLTQAAIGLREIAEPGEDPIRFLESYTRDSSVLNPRSVIEIMESRRYVGD